MQNLPHLRGHGQEGGDAARHGGVGPADLDVVVPARAHQAELRGRIHAQGGTVHTTSSAGPSPPGRGLGEEGDDLGAFAHLDGVIANLYVFMYINLGYWYYSKIRHTGSLAKCFLRGDFN